MLREVHVDRFEVGFTQPDRYPQTPTVTRACLRPPVSDGREKLCTRI